MKVPLGRILATPGALEALENAGQDARELLSRHQHGDWGDLYAEDRAANEQALQDGSRLLSAYTLRSGVRLWVITEWDRSATTLVLPEEY